jgi:hypothetical protein
LNYEVEEIEHNGVMAHSIYRKGTREELSRVLTAHLMPCSCSCKVSYGIQCGNDLAINGVFGLGSLVIQEDGN